MARLNARNSIWLALPSSAISYKDDDDLDGACCSVYCDSIYCSSSYTDSIIFA